MMLTCVIFSIIYVTNDKILKHRTRKAGQRRPRTAQRARYPYRSSRGNGRSISNIQAPSLPICSRSAEDWGQSSHTRFQNYIYRKAISKVDSINTRLCQSLRTYHKRYRNPGLRNIFIQRPKAWLLENQLQNKFIWNIVLTDYQPRKLCWLTNF